MLYQLVVLIFQCNIKLSSVDIFLISICMLFNIFRVNGVIISDTYLIDLAVIYYDFLVLQKLYMQTRVEYHQGILIVCKGIIQIQRGRPGYDRVQSMPITTNVGSLNPTQGEVNSIQHYVIKFVSDWLQVGGFLWFPPPIKLI